LSKSGSNLNKCPFNSIYIEEEAYEYPITQQLLEKYTGCPVIRIKHYKDVFNRTNQHFRIQKEHLSLILAVKDKQFLYKGPEVCQNFGYTNFYYTSFILNCIFDCEYCYLQGMYPSANIVAFVNIEDYKNAIADIAIKEPVYLAASYDTDLIAFHNIIPYMDDCYNFFVRQRNLFVEIRTKSANQAFYKNYPAADNIIIAFSLAPQEIIDRYEKHTPSLESRIKAIQTATANGYKVRICFDPVFIGSIADDKYEVFYRKIFEQINPDKILDVGYGFFRMSRDFFKRIEKQRSNSLLYLEDYCVDDNIVSYSKELQEITKEKHFKAITQYIDKEKIYTL